MKTWIVSGGVGCGKSLFCRLLGQLSARMVHFDCDLSVHRLLTTQAIVRKVASTFGAGVLNEAGELCREGLRKLIFSSDAAREELERILHPAVYGEMLKSIDRARTGGDVDCFVADVPLFFESDPPELNVDQVLVVAASRDVQVRRITERSNGDIDPQLASQIVDAQLPIEVKTDQADRVVWNNGSMNSLRRQASRVAALV